MMSTEGRQRRRRSAQHGGAVVQLRDPPPDGAAVPGTPLGVFERRLLLRTYTSMPDRPQLMDRDFKAWFARQAALTRPVLQTLGVTWQPRLAGAVFSPPVAPLNGALVQADHRVDLAPNYIASLLAARDLDAIRSGSLTRRRPPPCSTCCCAMRCCWNTRPPRRVCEATAKQPWSVAARAAPRAGAGESARGTGDANRLVADGPKYQRAGRRGADGAWELSARLHSLRRP